MNKEQEKILVAAAARNKARAAEEAKKRKAKRSLAKTGSANVKPKQARKYEVT